MSDLDVLPDLLPPDVEPLRARVRTMLPDQQTECLAAWGRLPHLANEDGTSAVLDQAAYRLVERHIASFEAWADEAHHADLIARIDDLPPGPRHVLNERLRTLLLDGPAGSDTGAQDPGANANYRNRLHFTTGRAATIEKVLHAVLDEADEVIAGALGPLGDPGVIISQPVTDAAELADVIDWSALKVADVLATVGASPSRARSAYDAEMRRVKPRAGVIEKLAPLVGGQVPPQDALTASTDPVLDVVAPEATGPLVASETFGGAESTVQPDAAPPMFAEGVEAPVTHATTPSGGDRLTELCTTPDADLTPEDRAELTASLQALEATPSLVKYAAILGRIHAELGAIVRMLDADLHRVDL